jgi:hypothetical protein
LAGASHVEAGDFGTRCQKSYQNGWLNTLPYAYARCGGFNDELDSTDTLRFYFDLTGTGSGFTVNDGSTASGGVDSVDLFYVSTHGGTTDVNARLALWGDQQRVRSSEWRLGNNSDQVMIFSQYACATMKEDGHFMARWSNPFRGGVYIVTGSQDKVYDGLTTDETGEDYADDLQDGKSVKWAWFDGNGDWWADQDVAVYATGSSLANCRNRRDGITWQNASSFTRLRDNNVARVCGAWIWDN